MPFKYQAARSNVRGRRRARAGGPAIYPASVLDGGRPMCPRGILGACTTAGFGAVGQQKCLNEQLVGTWTLVSWDQRNAAGSTVQQFGADPKGIAFFDTSGHYVITVMRADRAKYTIDDFRQIAQITAEESKATAQGTITYFGTYSVDEADQAIAIRVEASSFPN